MDAKDVPITTLLDGAKQFIVPIFQRDYSWGTKQCLALWNDIIRVGSDHNSKGHFLGSVVYIAAEENTADLTRWLLIDGQQRLTTLTLIMLALRARLTEGAEEPGEDSPTPDAIDDYYLRNRHGKGDRRYKLHLRRADHATLAALLDDKTPGDASSERIMENFQFLKDHVGNADLQTAYNGIKKLVVVHVCLTRGQYDPQMIFESLNSTGLDLTPADLIRNFVLMRLDEQTQTRLYEDYWQPIETAFGARYRAEFDTFVRDYLTIRLRASTPIRSEAIYQEFCTYFTRATKNDTVEKVLADLKRFGTYYTALSLGNEEEPDLKTVFDRLHNLIEVAAPVVLTLYDCYDRAKTLTLQEFIQAVELVESYVFRRSVCDLQTRSLGQIFASLANRIQERAPLTSLQVALYRQSKKRRFPNDNEFREALETRDVYDMRNCFYLLDRLENFSKERIDTSTFTIEHVMPQNEDLRPEWRTMLGPDWKHAQETWLHRLGNVTLTGYNATYSDRPFNEKKTIHGGFDESPLRLNKFIREQPTWSATEIQERGTQLSNKSLSVWPPLKVDIQEVKEAELKERIAQAEQYKIDDLAMDAVAKQLFDALRPQLQRNVSGHSNTEFGVPRKVDANGFNDRINYQLDGSSNVESDRAGIRLLPISETWIQEVQAVNNGFAPEFGNTVGALFNTITRSGTNELHGEAAYLFRRTPMSARPALLPDNQQTPDVNVDSVFADAGGRLVKDRVFFFGGYEHVKRDLPAPVTVAPATLAQLGLPANFANAIPFSQSVTFFIGKVDWQLTSKHRLSLRYNGHRNDSPYNSSTIGGLFLLDRTFKFVDRSHGGAAQLVSVISPNAVNELRFQVPFRSQSQNRFEATGSGPAISIPGVANFGNSLDVGFRFDEMTPEVSENFSYNLAQHALKFGGSFRAIRDTQVQATAALYTFPSIAAYVAARDGLNPRTYVSFIQTVGEPSMTYNSLFSGLYAQDTWKPRANITVTYGVRYDVYRPPEANTTSPFAYSQRFRTDKNNIAPRLGVAVGRGKTVVRASGGIFYDPFQTDQYRRALLNNGTPSFFAISAIPQLPFAPAFPNVFSGVPQGFTPSIQDITTVSADFASLYSVNANVSISREITRDLAFTATYLFTRGNRLPVIRNINLVPSGQRLADGRPIFGSARVFPGFGNILSAESVGQSVYNGLNLTLNKRLSRGFEMFATYTWSHAIDDAPEQNNIDSPNFLLSDPSNRRRDRGNSLTDRRHAFNGNLLYTPVLQRGGRVLRYLVNGNRIAVIATIQSGDVFNMGSNRVLNGDPSTASTFQRPLFIGRNTLRVPRTSEFNVRYTRLFPIGERMRLEFIAESTNIFNRTNVVGLNSTATVDAAGNIVAWPSLAWTAALDQRLVQLGFKFSF